MLNKPSVSDPEPRELEGFLRELFPWALCPGDNLDIIKVFETRGKYIPI